ncbi:MAG: hypothetical protein FJW39_20430 [Acidobacteria bacterium]|nr:hypothetical protein [Acidobacteriota bacterium]
MDAQDRFLVDRSEEAIRDGLQLYRWCIANIETHPRHKLDLGKRYRLANTAEGFWGECPVNGRPVTLMGTRQEIAFSRIEGSGAAQRLRDFVLKDLLNRASWRYPDGEKGGFEFHRSVYQKLDGEYAKFPPGEDSGAVNWLDLGVLYRWVLLRTDIHDFVMEMGPFKKKLAEAACVVAHPDFIRVTENPEPGYEFEAAVGYPFIRFAPIPNFFGFGPGKFDLAVKTFSFLIKPGGDVVVRMYFAAMPRCERVFDFGSLPDPVYGGARLLRKLSGGAFNEQAFHDKIDSGMLAQHCRVHQAFIEGVETVFQQWLVDQRGGKST